MHIARQTQLFLKINSLSPGTMAESCWENSSEEKLFLTQSTFTVKSDEYDEPLPGVLGNTGTVAFIFREQGIFSNYFQGTGELLTRLLGSREHQFTFNNGQ